MNLWIPIYSLLACIILISILLTRVWKISKRRVHEHYNIYPIMTEGMAPMELKMRVFVNLFYPKYSLSNLLWFGRYSFFLVFMLINAMSYSFVDNIKALETFQ